MCFFKLKDKMDIQGTNPTNKTFRVNLLTPFITLAIAEESKTHACDF